MNFNVDRNGGGQVLITLALSEDEARKLANLVRELIGDARPPAAPQPWKRLEAPKGVKPKPPTNLRASIQKQIGRVTTPSPRSQP